MAKNEIPFTRREQQLVTAALTCASGHPELTKHILVLEWVREVQQAPAVTVDELREELDALHEKLVAWEVE